MNLIEQGIALVCKVLLWISTVIIFFILVANTILRYATGASLQWANEVPELLFPWLVMAGVVLAALHGAHITTSFLMEKIGYKARRVVGVLGWLIVGVLYGVLSKATFDMLDIVHDEKSPILQLPGSLTYGCVMVGMAMLALLAVFSAWRVWTSSDEIPTDAKVPAVHW
jgi:TRAP-type C4-dicarboxylate transport system permease small subunit